MKKFKWAVQLSGIHEGREWRNYYMTYTREEARQMKKSLKTSFGFVKDTTFSVRKVLSHKEGMTVT